MPAMHFRDEGKVLKTAFGKRWRHDNHVISRPVFSSKHNTKMTGDCCVFEILWRSVYKIHLRRNFRVKTPFSNFSVVV